MKKAANSAALQTRYGDVGQVVGPFDGSLSNAGELLELWDADGQSIVRLEYADSGLWPVRADGIGASLVARDPITSDGKHYRWRGSTEFGGSPGTPEQPELGVVINEVIGRTSAPTGDQIEILNRSSNAVDLSGWGLSDRTDNFTSYTLPHQTTLAPGAFLVLNENQFNAGGNGFGLSANGDSVWLTVPGTNGQPVSFVDDVHFGGSRLGESLGRLPNGEGPLAPLAQPSFGTTNVDSRTPAVVISEVHYHPVAPTAATEIDPDMTEDQLEFIELTNLSDTTVDLGNWRLRGGVEMNFDAGTQLASGQAIVVTSFNPDNSERLAAFRAEFGLSEDVQFVGGFGGGLNNGADQIRLLAVDPNNGDLIRPLEDEVIYDDETPWPTTPDGQGSSLTRSNPHRWGTLHNAWAAALPNPGVPATTRLAGDVTADGVVDAADVDQLCANLRAGSQEPSNDLNEDGVFTEDDLNLLVEDILGTSAGDADLNGRFDSEDLVAVFIAGQYNDGIDGNSTWATGDWNCDGEFDSEDLVAAFISGAYQT